MSPLSSAPVLQTSKFKLRPFILSDAKEVQRQAGDPRVAATTLTIPHPYLDGAAEAWISSHNADAEKGLALQWAIESLKDNRLVGCISLAINKNHRRAELGYWIGADFWNQGIGTEAAIKVTEFAFKVLNLNKITARHMYDNPGSGRIMQKIGMEKEGLTKQEVLKNGKFVDLVVYGFLKEDYLKK